MCDKFFSEGGVSSSWVRCLGIQLEWSLSAGRMCSVCELDAFLNYRTCFYELMEKALCLCVCVSYVYSDWT